MPSTNLLIDFLAAELGKPCETLAAIADGIANLDGCPDDLRVTLAVRQVRTLASL